MNYFFDSYAVIDILRNNRNYEKYNSFIIFTTSLNLTEIYYALLNEIDEDSADILVTKLNFQFIEITPEIAVEAAKFRSKNKKLKLSYADCIGYMAAIKHDIKFLTGDSAFEKFNNVEFVK